MSMTHGDEFQIIGHRGVPCDAPENTLPSFLRASELGLTHVECDLRLTRDGHVVLMHDSTVERTTDGEGKVSELTLEEIRELDCGSWFSEDFTGERVPTLHEFFDALDDDMHAILEVKETHRQDEATRKVLRTTLERGMVCRVSVTSFYWNVLELVRTLEPIIETQALVRPIGSPERSGCGPVPIACSNVDAFLDDPRLSSADVVCPRAGDVDPALIERIHTQGFPVRVWGARTDRREEILHILRCGVDGMTADHPQYVRTVCEEWFDHDLSGTAQD